MEQKLIKECLIVGCISILLFFLYNYITTNYNDNNYINKNNKSINENNMKLFISAFLIGCLFHIAIEYIGLNEWQCEKKCYIDGTCELICRREI